MSKFAFDPPNGLHVVYAGPKDNNPTQHSFAGAHDSADDMKNHQRRLQRQGLSTTTRHYSSPPAGRTWDDIRKEGR